VLEAENLLKARDGASTVNARVNAVTVRLVSLQILESLLKVIFPEHFVPGLGSFIGSVLFF
jgi:hypothetical protein